MALRLTGTVTDYEPYRPGPVPGAKPGVCSIWVLHDGRSILKVKGVAAEHPEYAEPGAPFDEEVSVSAYEWRGSVAQTYRIVRGPSASGKRGA